MDFWDLLFLNLPSKHKHAGPVRVVGGRHGLPRDGLWPGLTLGSTRVPPRFYPLIPCVACSTNMGRVDHVRYQ